MVWFMSGGPFTVFIRGLVSGSAGGGFAPPLWFGSVFITGGSCATGGCCVKISLPLLVRPFLGGCWSFLVASFGERGSFFTGGSILTFTFSLTGLPFSGGCGSFLGVWSFLGASLEREG